MWVARDKDGTLVCLTSPPIRHADGYWRGILSTNSTYGNWSFPYLDNKHRFDNLKWEDEPIEVELIKSEQLSDIVAETLKLTGISEEKQAEIFAYMLMHNFFIDNE